MSNNMNPIHEKLADFGYAWKSDEGTGWEYHDEPHGGFLIIEKSSCVLNGEGRNGEDLDVELAVCAEFTDLGDACGEPGFLVNLSQVVSPDSLSEDSLQRVAGSCGLDPDEITYYDVASYGYSNPVNHVWGAETWQEGWDELRGLSAFAGVASGFPLDSAYNRLGTTGWDVVRDAVLDVDAHEASMDRLRVNSD